MLNDFSSDSMTILTCLSVDGHWKDVPISKSKWNLNKANWPLFNKMCNNIELKDCKSNNIDSYNDNLINKIINMASKYIPISAMTNRKKKAVPWWSTEIELLIKQRFKARSTL